MEIDKKRRSTTVEILMWFETQMELSLIHISTTVEILMWFETKDKTRYLIIYNSRNFNVV